MPVVKLFSRVLLPLTALFLLAGCPGPDWPKCENDDHCQSKRKGNEAGKDFKCVFGKCLECGRESDCSPGEKCSDGRCEKKCAAASDCASGLVCKAGDCVAAPPKAECAEAGDCESGFTCKSGKCTEEMSTEPGDDNANCDTDVTVRFEFGLYDLTPEARESLETFANCMTKNAGWKLTIAGHADERGTTQFNLDLGEKRAVSVKEYISKLGVKSSRIRTVSYGEERPLVNRSDEGAWDQNRRAELSIQK